MDRTTQPMMLVISDAADDSLREAVSAVRAAGAVVEQVDDVYTAMARLAKGERFARVLLDARCVDRHEFAFFHLAPRYFPEAVIEVPWLAGTTQALVALDHADINARQVVEIVASFGVTAPDAEITSEPPIVRPEGTPLSTDGLATALPAEPSLHDAVRMRMAAGEVPGAPVRRPPSRTPPAPRSESTANDTRQLTPDELEALFDSDALDDDTGGENR